MVGVGVGVRVHVRMCTCACVHVCACACVYVCMFVHAHACTCACVSVLRLHLDIFVFVAVAIGVEIEVAVGPIVLDKMLAASFELAIAVDGETKGLWQFFSNDVGICCECVSVASFCLNIIMHSECMGTIILNDTLSDWFRPKGCP